MKKYDVTLTAHYQKTVSVYAESPEQAKEKTKIILFDTDLINFTDDDFVCGEADITEQREDGLDGKVTVPARAEEISVRESVGTDFLGTLYKKAAISAKDGCLFFQFIFNLDPVI